MFKNITLEMSLKPFRQTDDMFIEKICIKAFEQWKPLLKDAEIVSVMLWTADGSEILEYKGDMDEEFDWGRYIGIANPMENWAFKLDPQRVGLHARNYLYMENPPVFTYKILKNLVNIIKTTGKKVLGDKKIRVGATFDPGPEFAKSDFKHNRHKEICMGKLGSATMVCADSKLDYDETSYAGFPDGIPQDTPFGTFLGRQSQHFLTDMGFDYLWLSNGFGFGTDPWGSIGSIFDGEKFNAYRLEKVKEGNLDFWRLFRKECPDFPVETRGTNLTAGIDYASDGVPLADIYNGGFNISVPPNSPWAALDGDFGLELAGYMSRMAELPAEDYLFRFYIHDPWWLNSPWIDRYEGYPHDIYLPLSVARVNGKGEITAPARYNMLTIDDSYGDMPERVPNEVIPHICTALSHFPDKVSPVVWVYPFNEYQTATEKHFVEQMYNEDWFVRGAINNGFPLNTVVSTDNFIKTVNRQIYDGSIIFTVVPQKNSDFEQVLIKYIEQGGNVILYGSATHASDKILKMLDLHLDSGISGKLSIYVMGNKEDKKIIHREIICGGGIDTISNNDSDVFAQVEDNLGNKRTLGIYKKIGKGSVAWLRGTCSAYYEKGQFILKSDNANEYFIGETLPLMILGKFGYEINFVKSKPACLNPVLVISRNNNGFIYSGYMPDTTVEIKMRTMFGAPIFLDTETIIKDGFASYRFPRAWHKECRVFVRQDSDNVISCKEYCKQRMGTKRRIKVSGLENATVVVFPESGYEDKTSILQNTDYPYISGDPFELREVSDAHGKYFILENISGALDIGSMDFFNA